MPPPDRRLRVLLTARVLARRTGTELYVRDVAVGLLRRGHHPIVYSPRLGPLAEEIRGATVAVVDDLAQVGEPPHIIHGQHTLETLTALLAFPRVPAVSVCHSWMAAFDEPLAFPRIGRYIAVDDTCRDRLVSEHGVAPDRVEVVLNAVDLARFTPRPPLPARPAKALIFGNSTGAGAPHLGAIREACAASRIAVDVGGAGAGRTLDQPERALGSYDLVFAKARAALEAAATGAAVILCDITGAGPMVTTSNVERLRRLNFGMRALDREPTVTGIAAEIARYDAADAAAVSRLVRTHADLETQLDQLLGIYDDVLEQAVAGSDADAEMRAAAAFLRRLSPRLYERDLLHNAFRRLLRVPVAGALLRGRARRTDPSHWFQELLRAMDGK